MSVSEDTQRVTLSANIMWGYITSPMSQNKAFVLRVKGGKLATGAHPDIPLVSLIVSDIVGDPIDLIASGPTVTRFTLMFEFGDNVWPFEFL